MSPYRDKHPIDLWIDKEITWNELKQLIGFKKHENERTLKFWAWVYKKIFERKRK